MKTNQQIASLDENTVQSRSFLGAVSRIPKQELFQFAIFLIVQSLQWSALLMMCNTQGKFGTANFITTMMLSASVGISLEKLNTIHKFSFFLSTLAMCIYFLTYGW